MAPVPATGETCVSRDPIGERWEELADRLRRRWRRLTSDDVEFPAGNVEYLVGLLQRRYGFDRHEALLQVYEFESEL
jgi:hypothetical protein